MIMANFIASVRGDANAGYTASFPDFPGCTVSAREGQGSIVAKAREASFSACFKGAKSHRGAAILAKQAIGA